MSIKNGVWLIICCIIFSLLTGFAEENANQVAKQAAGLNPPTIEEKTIFEIPPAAKDLTVSSDGRHVFWKEKKGKKWVIVVNGESGPEFDGIEIDSALNTYAFSPDGQHFAYCGRRGENSVIILDGKELEKLYPKGFGWGGPVGLTFSADSQHFAYFAGAWKKFRLIVDGQEQGPESDIAPPVSKLILSPDGKRWAYWSKVGKEWAIVADGSLTDDKLDNQEMFASSISFNPNKRPVFSPDGQHLAYPAKRMGRILMVLDGKELLPPKIKGQDRVWNVSKPLFSPDSGHFAYITFSTKCGVIVDGRYGSEFLEFEAIHAGPIFSPDSRHIAYIGESYERGSRFVVQVIDDQVTYPTAESKIEANACLYLVFSPDSQRLAYVIRSSKWHLVLDGRQYGPARERIASLAFSPEGRFLAYCIERGKKVGMVINESEGKGYDYLWPDTLAFSADEKQATYVAQEGNKLFIVTQTVE